MQILFISRWFPYPPNNGSKIRIFNLIKRLSRNHKIILLSFVEERVSQQHMTMMKRYCHTVHTTPLKVFHPKRLKALVGFFSLRPRFITDTYSPEMQKLVKTIDENHKIDVVIASEKDTILYPLPLTRTPRVLEDIELGIIHEQFIKQNNPLLRLRYGMTWWKLSRFTARMLREYDGVTIVSDKEQHLLRSLNPPHHHYTVVPNGVDLKTNTGDFGTPKPNTLIYSGSLTYHANFDAMRFFLDDIHPLVKRQHPFVQLRITGSYKGVPIEQLHLDESTELTGYLDDIRPAIAQSWACVVPLQVGGGTRLKILEAMALGTPVVSTSKGAEGLKVTPKKDILIADDPKDFSQALVKLLKDKGLREELSVNGRHLVEEHYTWDICAQHLEDLLLKVTVKK